MCGIAGIVGSSLPDRRVIARMTELLHHRGPDGSGLWHCAQAHLGHARLSILDLSSAGQQPMLAGQLVLTYNGEIYNFRQLRQQLEGPFRSETDSEVVLHAFQKFGADCVNQFNGMFAFAIWDQEKKELFAARDRLGIKPLYYRPLEDGIAFASEVAPLLEIGRPELNRGALADYLTYGYVPTPKTAWQGIYKLPAAHTLHYRDGQLSIRRYWQPQTSEEIVDPAAAAAETEALLKLAIEEHTLADVPVGLFLSSGLDSSAILALGPANALTFTLGQTDRHRDEAGPARELARHLGSTHHESKASAPNLAEAVTEMVSVFGEPFGDSAALSVWLLSRFVRQHVKVALSGEGGDEVFCGYRWYGSAMTRPASPLSALLAKLAPTMSRFGRSQQRRSLRGLERYAAFLGVFTPRQTRYLLGPWLRADLEEEDRLWHFRRYWRDELPLHQRLQWADMHTYLPDGLLTKVDRASMAWSLEVRPPLLDYRLVELALRFDRSLQRDPESDRGKVILRSLLEPRLPPGHLALPKRGFNLPIARWIRKQPEIWKAATGRLQRHGVIRRSGPLRLNNEQTWALLILDGWLARNESGYR